ncbi:putative membrane protein [Escherichia coli 2-222-05_S4_C2]|nr:putative membrane protein [Escherichia coli 2-222-05_S4_C2]KEO17005.1 putative membrane protein [Escherichia coli 2-222-05_S4_C3]
MISSDSSFLVLLGIFIAMLYPAGVVRLFSKYTKEIKQ